MAKVIVNSHFILTRKNGVSVTYNKGHHDMPDEDVGHWWTKQFIEEVPIVEEPVDDTPIEEVKVTKKKIKAA